MGIHKHHIIPKHMGGSNDPSNLIELTVEEHAEAHRVLYEQHGKWQDLLAWKALSGQISTDDIRRELTRLTWLGRKHTPESINKIKEKRAIQTPPNLGREFSEDHRNKLSIAHSGKKLTSAHKQNIGNAIRGRPKPQITCPHCGKVGGAPQMHQWHFDHCKLRK